MGKIVGLTFDEEQKYLCPHCGKEYESADALAKHIEEHPGEDPSDPTE